MAMWIWSFWRDTQESWRKNEVYLKISKETTGIYVSHVYETTVKIHHKYVIHENICLGQERN